MFKVGDVVQLKSGGQSMTVMGRNADKDCRCLWMRPDGTLAGEPIPAECLLLSPVRISLNPAEVAGLAVPMRGLPSDNW